MADVCSRVPAKSARTFREAINSIWIVQVAIHAENINMAMSPGRLDQILYKFYKEDIDKGILSVKEAMELAGCLWLKLNDNTNLVPETAEELWGGAGTVPAVTVGGIDENGEDAVNDLTYIMLRVTELLKTRDPSLNSRYHYEKNSEEYRDRLAEVIVNTKAVPAIHNDVAVIKVLENQGTKLEHARDYAVIGCVELASAGRSYDASSSIMLNLVSVLELALNNGKRPITGDEQIGPKTGEPSQFNSFEKFWEAFKNQSEWLIGKAIDLNEYFGHAYQEILPSPLLSAFFEGPMQTGKDLIFGGALYNSSGATHIAFADTVDS
ncbi:MAG: pyruvate formate lyase family protein, partial [Proteobacteria bacterium]|nr:pyruvate formate lyase family protein [Pseudomonadota bacterium]